MIHGGYGDYGNNDPHWLGDLSLLHTGQTYLSEVDNVSFSVLLFMCTDLDGVELAMGNATFFLLEKYIVFHFIYSLNHSGFLQNCM